MTHSPALNLGAWRHLDGGEGGSKLLLPANHLVTHSVIVGMTGSGKTGLVTVLVEEALNAGIPTVVVDVKGDLPNLLLAFPSFDPAHYAPWIEADASTPEQLEVAAQQLAEQQRNALEPWGIGGTELKAFCDRTSVRVITPGASSGESLHLLSALERRSARWDTDPESARDALSAAVSLVLRLLGRDPDPAKSREHVLLERSSQQWNAEEDRSKNPRSGFRGESTSEARREGRVPLQAEARARWRSQPMAFHAIEKRSKRACRTTARDGREC